MARVGSRVSALAHHRMVNPSGMSAAVQAMADLSGLKVPSFGSEQIITQNVVAEISEQSKVTKYPLVYLYCSDVKNRLREKFRTFSGEATMVAEIRVSQDRLDGLDSVTQFYVEAVLKVLDDSRGTWDRGVTFSGGYDVSYGPVKRGGRNFLQTAKIGFVLDVSES